METGAGLYELDGKAIGVPGQSVEAGTVANVAEDVIGHIICPSGHILWLRPCILLHTVQICSSSEIAHGTAERLNDLQDVRLQPSHRTVGECLREHSPLPSMKALVNGTVSAPCSFGSREDRVETGFPDIGFETVNALQGSVCVYGDGIRAIADYIAVLLVEMVEIEVSMSGPGVVDRVEVCHAAKERTWVLG